MRHRIKSNSRKYKVTHLGFVLNKKNIYGLISWKTAEEMVELVVPTDHRMNISCQYAAALKEGKCDHRMHQMRYFL